MLRLEKLAKNRIEAPQMTNAPFVENLLDETVFFTVLDPRKNYKNQPIFGGKEAK